ncbi:MAG: HIT family protein, partial [Thermomicrobiales bacterium]
MEKLWTPWRMGYIGGPKAQDCIFCDKPAAGDDRANLILYRGAHTFVIMNLFPYNTGHVLIVPYAHTAALPDLPGDALGEMTALLPWLTAIITRALRPDGFNIGMNLGAVAGAGVADHLHLHVVPRWIGDANFMPILASTTVMPKLLPATYAKLRAEFERGQFDGLRLVVLDPDARRVLFDTRNHRFPGALLKREEAAWRSGVEALREFGVLAHVIDWAGAPSTSANEPAALLMQSRSESVETPLAWI